MEEQTKPPFEEPVKIENGPITIHHSNESQIGGLTIRSLLVLIIVTTVCVMSYVTKKVEEPLYTLASLTVGYYFGQNQTSKTPVIKQ